MLKKTKLEGRERVNLKVKRSKRISVKERLILKMIEFKAEDISTEH